MEPMLPEESTRELEDIAFELTSKASSLAGHMAIQTGIHIFFGPTLGVALECVHSDVHVRS
jgi:hypothetical protein